MPSEYDALLEPSPTQSKSEYDALLQQPNVQQPSGFQKGLDTAQKVLGVAQEAYLASIAPGFAFVPDILKRPLISEETATKAVSYLPPVKLAEVAFGKEKAEPGERLAGQLISESSSPENIALMAVPGIAGKLATGAKIGELFRPSTLRDIAFGKIESEPLAAETAATKEVIKNASEIPSAERVPSAQVRPGVDEKAPLRQQGQAPEVRQEAQVGTQVTPVPQPEQPRIISTAVKSGDTIIRGEGFEPHDSIAARVASQRPSPTQETGIAPSPITYVSKDDVHTQSSMGGGTYLSHKTEGSVLKGQVVNKEQLPETLYHVTTNNDLVNTAGILVGDPKLRAGLGKGTSAAHQGVSFTSSLEDAKLIEQELRRATELSKGNVTDFADWLDKTARSDETAAGLSKGKLQRGVDEALRMFGVNVRPDSNVPSNMLDAYNFYLHMRESDGGAENPLLMGGWRAYSQIDPSQIKLLKVPTKGIPDNALIRKSPIGQDFMHEVMVHSDVPIERMPVPEGGTKPSGVAAAQQRIPENQKGFIIREPDGTERFTNDRAEAAKIANAAGQVKPENAGTTELHSQQLSEHPLQGQIYYRGTNPNRVSGEDQFYSAHKETAEEYAAGGPGGVEGNVEQVKGESLPRNLYKAFNKEELAKTLGIRSDIYGKKFDNIVKQKLQSQGYAGVQYELGTALGDLSSPGETEIHVFSRKAQPVSEAGQTPAVSTLPEQKPSSAAAVSGTEMPPAAAPPEPPETPEALGQALNEKPRLAGPSNRVLQERAARGEIPQAPESGHGILKEDLLAQSRAEYSPERAQVAAANIKTGRSNLADEGVAVAHEEALTKAAADAERALKANPTELTLQQAYQSARNEMTDWQHEVIQPMKTAWSNKGINLQGATDVDTGTLVGLQKLAWDTGKGDIPIEQHPIFDEAANRVRIAEAEEKASISKANEAVQKVLKPSRYMDLNQLRESLATTLKSMTC